jgi:predicted molibdopterin-dependent oxidoreductase YjgC
MTMLPGSPQLFRVAENDRASITLWIDGRRIEAMEGDTLLVAVLVNARRLRTSEFGDGPRAGFCLMGACQDCWIWTESGKRLRACSTAVEPEMRVVTGQPDGLWPRRA